jgi:hypothetical protein
MPVTFSPAPHNTIEPCERSHYATAPCTPMLLLADVTAMQDKRKGTAVKEHLQSTFGRDSARPIPVVPSRNGFVATVIEAYSNHQALVIRPDDVWICILTQFSLFLNGGRAEQLRHLFVAHEGKQRLTINMIGTRSTVDFGQFAQVMTDQIHENVVDPELQAWFLPAFSTTTSNDTIVASAVMMATLKSYFDYQAVIMRCGLPRVTLLGTQADWRDIFDRLDRLGRYGPETTAWRRLLEPVLARFVRAFEPGYADSAENRHFWQHVASRQWGGSGMSSPWLTGWITAFCAFDVDGSYKGTLQAVSPVCRPSTVIGIAHCISPTAGAFRTLMDPLVGQFKHSEVGFFRLGKNSTAHPVTQRHCFPGGPMYISPAKRTPYSRQRCHVDNLMFTLRVRSHYIKACRKPLFQDHCASLGGRRRTLLDLVSKICPVAPECWHTKGQAKKIASTVLSS